MSSITGLAVCFRQRLEAREAARLQRLAQKAAWRGFNLPCSISQISTTCAFKISVFQVSTIIEIHKLSKIDA